MKKDLKKQIKEYKQFYKEKSKAKDVYHKIINHPNIIIKKALISSKKYKYYKENHATIINKVKMIYYGRKNNKYANKYNIEIYGNFGNCNDAVSLLHGKTCCAEDKS